MKNLVLAVVLLFGVSFVNAQDKTAKEYKIEGADAYKAKDYQKGLTAFEKSINLYEKDGKTDTTLYYNAGVCAYKIKDYDKSVSYFDKAISLNYKSCKAYLYKANILNKQKKYDEMQQICETGISKCPKYKSKFDKILFNYNLKQGIGIYNTAAKKQSAAAKYATTNPEKYKAEIAKVNNEFKKSIPYLEKAHKLNSSDETCKKALKEVYTILGMDAKAATL